MSGANTFISSGKEKNGGFLFLETCPWSSHLVAQNPLSNWIQVIPSLCDDVTSDLVNRRVSLMISSNHAEDDQGCEEKIPEIAFMDDIFFHITKGYDFTHPLFVIYISCKWLLYIIQRYHYIHNIYIYIYSIHMFHIWLRSEPARPFSKTPQKKRGS